MDAEAVPLGTEGMTKDDLLRLLQKKIYFVKTVAASYAANNPKHCAMALPAGFVKEHGDKFEQSVCLRSGFCEGELSWRVHLSIVRIPPYARREVKLSGGWRAFATDNDLAVGDSLIFCLRAMSEFVVYVFRDSTEDSVPAPPRIQRSRNFKETKPYKSVGSYRRRNLVNARSSRVTKSSDSNCFEKTLTTCAVSRAFQLTLPTRFMHRYAREIEPEIALHSVADGEMWTMRINIYMPDSRPQFMLECGAWKAFVVSNGLVRGDRVIFTLVAKSTFRVLIFRSSNARVRSRPPVKRFKGHGSSTFSQQSPAQSLRPRNFAVKVESESELLLSESEEDTTSTDSGLISAYSTSDSSSCSPSDVDSDSIFERRWSQGKSKSRIYRQASTTHFPMMRKAEFQFVSDSSSESE